MTDHSTATVPHGLRKNAVNALLEAGWTIAEVSANTGADRVLASYRAGEVGK